MAKNGDSPEGGKNAPPYIAYSTLKTLTGNLKAHGVPPRIDKSIMSNFSGAVAGQLMTALRFLDLIDKNEEPTQRFKALVPAFDTPDWPKQMRAVLENAYPEVFAIELATASPALLYEAFQKAYPSGGETVRKTVTFFLNAATDAQIAVSPYIMKSKKPRSAPTKRRAAGRSQRRQMIEDQTITDLPPAVSDRKLSEQVLEILDSEELPDDVESAVFTLLKYLRKEGK